MISKTRLHRLRVQGYCNLSDEAISDLAWGNRMAFILCSTGASIGIVFAYTPLVWIMAAIALGGALLPRHPFDYLYNPIAKWVNKPQLPMRTRQAKFACSMATMWLVAVATLFYLDSMVAGYVLGGLLMLVAWMVSILDLCIPSIIYNYLFQFKVED